MIGNEARAYPEAYPPLSASTVGSPDMPKATKPPQMKVSIAPTPTPTASIGLRDGWKGLLEDKHMPLTRDSTSGILHRGGTILGTSNRGNPLRDEPTLVNLARSLAFESQRPQLPIRLLGVTVSHLVESRAEQAAAQTPIDFS